MRENSKRSINQIFIIYHETKTNGNSIAFQKLADIVNIGVGTFYMDYYERGGGGDLKVFVPSNKAMRQCFQHNQKIENSDVIEFPVGRDG